METKGTFLLRHIAYIAFLGVPVLRFVVTEFKNYHKSQKYPNKNLAIRVVKDLWRLWIILAFISTYFFFL